MPTTHELQIEMNQIRREIDHLRSEFHRLNRIIRRILEIEEDVISFTNIQGDSMVPLAAGNTATFSTTAIPSNAVPDPTKIVWTSSDPTNVPVVVNPNDPSGLSALVAFPSTVAAGVSFSLTISYTNSDGTTATQTNSFVTVAPPPTDVTGFTDIVQSA